MTEQQRPDEDVEGHRKRFNQDAEGVLEDTEDDVEGHHKRFNQDAEGVLEGDDDVEGHMPRRPL
jgi:hypothetical protein